MQFKILYAMAIALFGANMAAGIATNSCKRDEYVWKGQTD